MPLLFSPLSPFLAAVRNRNHTYEWGRWHEIFEFDRALNRYAMPVSQPRTESNRAAATSATPGHRAHAFLRSHLSHCCSCRPSAFRAYAAAGSQGGRRHLDEASTATRGSILSPRTMDAASTCTIRDGDRRRYWVIIADIIEQDRGQSAKFFLIDFLALQAKATGMDMRNRVWDIDSMEPLMQKSRGDMYRQLPVMRYDDQGW